MPALRMAFCTPVAISADLRRASSARASRVSVATVSHARSGARFTDASARVTMTGGPGGTRRLRRHNRPRREKYREQRRAH